MRISGIKKRNQIYRTKKHGKVIKCKSFVFFILQQQTYKKFFITISTSRKIGNAVCRNKIRRWFHALIRQYFQNNLPNALVFVKTINKPTYEDVTNNVLKLYHHFMNQI